jgi:cytoskeleton protein RodZ
MAEERKRRRTRDNSHAVEAAEARAAQMTVGELLRHTREGKKLGLDEISSSIHVRVSQLKAIEDGHIDSLPGMTYALGFVKSYATYLKLDPIEIVAKFKAEHSRAPAKPELHFPEPLGESKMPDPMMLGLAAAGVFIILALWAIFSGGDDKAAEQASAIPLPPADTGTGITGSVINPPPADGETQMGKITDAPAGSVPAVDAEAIATGVPATADVKLNPVPVDNLVVPVRRPPEQPARPAAAVAAPVPAYVPQQQQQTQTQQYSATTTTTTTTQAAAPSDVINVKPGRSRITLQAKETSWVQINNPDGTVYKKLLRAGETVYAPEGPGSSITTTNAGGLDVYVDGQKVKSLGGKGDIVKEKLDAERLKRRGGAPSAQRPVRDY